MDNSQIGDCGAQNQAGHSGLVAGTTSDNATTDIQQQQATTHHGQNETGPSITDSDEILTLNNKEPPPGPPIANEASESPDSAASRFANLDENRIVKHIMVIGFHHKHGYQVDYCYPPLESNGSVFSTASKPISLPSCWKTLPLLCLPDGSHNYDSDTIYFTMPDNLQQQSDADNDQDSRPVKNDGAKSNEGIKTIFGTACYRQIQVDKLLNRTDDMTRVAVQKSVCVLSTKPLFGLIRSKLEMITHAYFEELDFSKVRILKLTYENLNSLLSRDSVKENATFLGLSARNLVSQFNCNMLVLFKAMLLEKKILFYKSPVRDLCSTIMSMCSLFTGLLESGGLDNSTCDLQLSPSLLEALKLLTPHSELSNANVEFNCDEESAAVDALRQEDKVFFSPSKQEVVILSESNLNSGNDPQSATDLIGQQTRLTDEMMSISLPPMAQEALESQGQQREGDLEQTGEYEVISEDDEMLSDGSIVDDPYALKLCRLKPEECGLPLQIFTRGSFCLPYLSISYLDLISDTRVRSFVIGATNFLFKQRREMYDVIVDMEESTIIINDPSLKKCLSLTTEDLRFMDYLSRHVKLDHSKPKDEFDLISNDITKWVGGDEWIRYHFRLYTLYLLKASKNPSSYELFNSSFVRTWKQSTNNYKIWDSSNKASILDGLQRKHPFGSATKGLNFSDMRLKLSYAVNSSEKGRMINQTLTGIGKWSIWNNLASAAQAATTASVSLASAASNSAATSTLASTLQATLTNNQADSATNQQKTTNSKDNQNDESGCVRDI